MVGERLATTPTEEAKRELAQYCLSGLKDLCRKRLPAQFHFDHYLGQKPKDLATMRFLPRVRQALSSYRPTWNRYDYSDGELSVTCRQIVGFLNEDPRNIRTQPITADEIPFMKFLETELHQAAREINAAHSLTPSPAA